MTNWLPVLDSEDKPAYRAIVGALERSLAEGGLRPGDRLPTHRALSEALGLSLGTVTRAYAEARRRGLVHGAVGRGTFVREAEAASSAGLAAAVDSSLIDLSLLVPPPLETGAGEPGIDLGAAIGRLAETRGLGRILEYQPHAGVESHRAAGAAWIGRTGLQVATDDVLVCASAQHALVVALSVLARPGDVLLTEALTSPGIRDLASWMQVRLHGLPMDEGGIVPEALEAACRAGVSRVLYTMPVLQNPTTATMPETRKREIAEIVRRYDVAIIEDGVNGLLATDTPTPLSAYAPHHAYYFTSLSKTIAPGVRVGYLRAPGSGHDRLEAAIRATMWMASPLLAELASLWIADGTAESVLALRRDEARARQEQARLRLGAFDYRADPSGFHLWLRLPDPWRSEDFAIAARNHGVAVTSPEVFTAGQGHTPRAVRLCLSGASTRARLAEGLEILARLLVRRPAPAPALL